MRNKRQFVGAFVIAAVLGAAMPLSADMGGSSEGSSACAFIYGLVQRGVPQFVGDMMWATWCDGQQKPW